MTTPPLNLDKPVQTRDGRPARIICMDAKRTQPIIALINSPSGESIEQYDSTGFWTVGRKVNSPHDLINVPEKQTITFWVNVYKSDFGDGYSTGSSHSSRDLADSNKRHDRVACLGPFTREFTVGEGL